MRGMADPAGSVFTEAGSESPVILVPMRYAVLSDIHGNLEALQAVLRTPGLTSADRILCLGDIVGYGANPQECIDLLRQREAICIAGNHDWAAAGKLDSTGFSPAARHAIAWTAGQLDAAHQRFLADLPLTWEEAFFMISHASPGSPGLWHYLFTPHDAQEHFTSIRHQLCLVGHTHIPRMFTLNESGAVEEARLSRPVRLRQNRYIINAGSVGQPRDRNPAAAYGILDANTRLFRLQRADYDIRLAQMKILKAGLPPLLAERLESGW